MVPAQSRSLPIDAPFDLHESWRLVPLGRHDPTVQRLPDGIAWCQHTPEGPATVHMHQAEVSVDLQAWGPGGTWLLDHAPAFTGLAQTPPALDLPRALLHPACRQVRLPTVFDALVRIILQQKVTFAEACRSWGLLVDRFGAPAPGPFRLHLPPAPTDLARVAGYAFTPLGIHRKMADTLRLVASRHAAIERAADRLPPTEFAQLLQKLRGIGPWTTGMLLGLYRAAPDAIVLADFHLPNTVAYALTGEHRADDARMVELLEPYRPHRMVVVRWIHAAGIQAPRRGHKLEAQPLPSHR